MEGKGKILIIEDDRALRKILAEKVSDEGYHTPSRRWDSWA